jgi:DNA-binding transcriptional LysR family regulator
MLNWDDLNYFLTLSRTGKLNLASKKLNVESTTISRRVIRLEKKLNLELFSKSPKGYFLTEMGVELLKYAERIENEVYGINEQFLGSNLSIKGKVRLSVGEGLGVEIISKNLYKFYESYPDIEIELLADTKSRSLSNRETDILISFSQPLKGRLKTWKVCDYYVNLYGTKYYLDNHNKIESIKDLKNHSFVSYVNEFIEFPELNYLNDLKVNVNVKFSSNNLRSQLLAVKNNIGLGLLHTFIADREPELKKVLENQINIKREYWMIVHENLFKLQRIKVVCKFITEIMRENFKISNRSLAF